MALLDDLKDFLENENIKDSKIALACSAGIDSMVLLDLLEKCHPKELISVLHLDHGLRDDSALALKFLEDYSKERNLSLYSKVLKPGDLAGDENSARKARYQFFEDTCAEQGLEHLFLAHNLNDQAETMLFRIIRGTNTAGLKGIPQKRTLNSSLMLYRPLLHTSREEILAYAKEHNVEFIEDSSNDDEKYARNRIRKKIISEAREINPQILNNASKLADIISEEQEFFDALCNEAYANLGKMPWSLESFRELPRIIQRKILERTFTANIDFVNNFLDAVDEGGFHRINYAKEQFFTVKQKKICLEAL